MVPEEQLLIALRVAAVLYGHSLWSFQGQKVPGMDTMDGHFIVAYIPINWQYRVVL